MDKLFSCLFLLSTMLHTCTILDTAISRDMPLSDWNTKYQRQVQFFARLSWNYTVLPHRNTSELHFNWNIMSICHILIDMTFWCNEIYFQLKCHQANYFDNTSDFWFQTCSYLTIIKHHTILVYFKQHESYLWWFLSSAVLQTAMQTKLHKS